MTRKEHVGLLSPFAVRTVVKDEVGLHIRVLDTLAEETVPLPGPVDRTVRPLARPGERIVAASWRLLPRVRVAGYGREPPRLLGLGIVVDELPVVRAHGLDDPIPAVLRPQGNDKGDPVDVGMAAAAGPLTRRLVRPSSNLAVVGKERSDPIAVEHTPLGQLVIALVGVRGPLCARCVDPERHNRHEQSKRYPHAPKTGARDVLPARAEPRDTESRAPDNPWRALRKT